MTHTWMKVAQTNPHCLESNCNKGNTGFILDKRIGVNQPKRLENAKILVANTGNAIHSSIEVRLY